MPKPKLASNSAVIDRLFYDLRREKDLLAQKRDIDGSLKAVRRSLALGIAELHARSGVVSVDFEKTDYACGCIVICGQVWRDCKSDDVKAIRDKRARDNQRWVKGPAAPVEKAKPVACDRRKKKET